MSGAMFPDPADKMDLLQQASAKASRLVERLRAQQAEASTGGGALADPSRGVDPAAEDVAAAVERVREALDDALRRCFDSPVNPEL